MDPRTPPADAALPPGPRTVRLADYAPPSHLVDRTKLTFALHPAATRVTSRIDFRPNPEAAPAGRMWLDGEGLRTLSLRVDGAEAVTHPGEDGMWVDVPEGPFVFEAEVEIDPSANTELSGLYVSNGVFCTQCEAQGFRRITWYPDRPDVMAPFEVRLESDLPVLLSNGDPARSGEGWAEWHDPWPKPAYLFALVAGDLVAQRDAFTTMEGRAVDLAIWTRPGPDEGRCAWAMDSLKRSMRWDEEVWGLAYDLDVFNIVAVDDFNAGAMENKGLNVFNSAVVLAEPAITTDAAFAWIEAVVAHEYFHNWTGNRITCRDWFQLCLKEGLTVYRDHAFSEDVRDAGTQRIAQVMTLRARQFREDAGPLAHPVRPESFVAIDNFYTATVYEKGAELVRMLRLIVGEAAWEKGKALYFERHDGQACTVEDWLRVFADASGRDLGQFARWYAQAGTPRLHVGVAHEGDEMVLRLRQETPPSPGQPQKAPVPIPIAHGAIGPGGEDLVGTRVHVMTEAEDEIRLAVPEGAVPSLLRGFSAPVIVVREVEEDEMAFALAHDADPFARWEAGTTLARAACLAAAREGAAPSEGWLGALQGAVTDEGQSPAFRAMLLALPSVEETCGALAQAGERPDPSRVHAAREAVAEAVAAHLEGDLPGLRAANATPGPYDPGAEAAGRRALSLAALGLLARRDGGAAAREVFEARANFTEELAAFGMLLRAGDPDAAATFRARWAHERLVMDRWFAVQIAQAAPEAAAEVAQGLTADPLYTAANPNRVRAVWGALGGHVAGFHTAAGYEAMADAIVDLGARNPQTAARLVAAFETWRRHADPLPEAAHEALGRIRASNPPREVAEMLDRLMG